jgi:hypothetical protein
MSKKIIVSTSPDCAAIISLRHKIHKPQADDTFRRFFRFYCADKKPTILSGYQLQIIF